MRTRSALAGLIVVVMLGGLGATPVGAQDDPTDGAGDAAADTTTTTTTTPEQPPPPEDDPPATDIPPPPVDERDGAGDGPTAADPPVAGAPATTSPPTTAAPPPAPAGVPASTVSAQDATVDAESDAVADTGHNTAANGAVQVIVADQAATTGGGTATTPAPGSGSGAGTAANDADGTNSGVGLALVVTGGASATGGATDDTISQKALVKAVGTGEIEIIQIALIVNLGVGIANSGGNTATGLDVVNVIGIGQGAGAGAGGGGTSTNGLTAANDVSGRGAITTGDATAIGNASDVRVTQAAAGAAGPGLIASDQAAGITSLGVAYGNTGLNVVIGNTVLQLVLVDQQAAGGGAGASAVAGNQAVAGNAATGMAAVTTGSAAATGNASSTGIDQLAIADAGDGGFVSILQRALVLNLGVALANTGMNSATGNQSLNVVDLQQQSIAGAFWASLQSLFGGSGWLGLTGEAANAVTAHNTSDGAALVDTGDATATGLAATTRVHQEAAGSAASGGQALLTQDATVTNAGLAVANTGGNDAAGLLALNAVISGQWAGLGDQLAGYLAQLGSGTATASPTTSSWALGDVLVDLFGEIHADEVLIDGFGALSGGQVEAAIAQALGFAGTFDGIAATGPSGGPRIRVRQVTGTLTINLGIASTGSNTAETATVNVAVIDQTGQAASDAQVESALGKGLRAALQAVVEGSATGDAALDPANLAVLVNAATGSAVVVTGDATATNATTIATCQTFATSPAVCNRSTPGDPVVPPSSPTRPVVPGVWSAAPAAPATTGAAPAAGSTGTADPGPVPASSAAGTLPRTGADIAPLARAGVVLLLAGLALRTAAGRHGRRRRPVPLPEGDR